MVRLVWRSIEQAEEFRLALRVLSSLAPYEINRCSGYWLHSTNATQNNQGLALPALHPEITLVEVQILFNKNDILNRSIIF